jgi:DNA-binding beta-propeller fold protein YncE
VDSDRNVWVTGHGSVVLKFPRNGRLLLTIGQFGQTGEATARPLLGNPTEMYVDTKANEVFVSDGYLKRRVVVFDSETGAYKRHWGAYGDVPDDGPPELYQPGQPLSRQFFVAHCIDVSKDGLVYVCDRQRNRGQVFTTSGAFVKEVVHTPDAPAGAGITVKGPSGTRPSRAPASARATRSRSRPIAARSSCTYRPLPRSRSSAGGRSSSSARSRQGAHTA